MSPTVTKKSSVLVIEDNAITRKVMRVALESAGYGVLEAPDGKTAVRLAKKEEPDLILQDFLLPDIDGLDLVKELRRSLGDRAIPILACTGLISGQEEARTLNGAFTDYLFKPVEPSQLLQTIERYLATAPAATNKAQPKIKVLAVDDDPIELKLEKLLLETQGFAVTTAKDGQEAWEMIQRSRPDAVVSDLIMPKMNGFDLCTALRNDRRYASLPIVVTSSTAPYIEDEDRKMAAKVGADAFVGRTPDLKEVVRALRAALNRRSHPKPTADSEDLKANYLQRIVSQLEQQSARNGDLIRHAAEEKAQLAVMASITQTLNKKLPLRAALDEALARILDAAGLSMGIVYLIEPDGKLVLKSQIGYAKSKVDELRDFFGQAALLRRSLEERKTLKMPSPDIAAATARRLQEKIQARSMLIAPLVVADEPQGVLVVFSSRSELGDDWVASFKNVTAQLAQAVLLARTLEKVTESERRFRELAENINEVFFVLNSDGSVVQYVSPAYEQVFGRKKEDLYRDARNWLDAVHAGDRGRVEQEHRNHPDTFNEEFRITRPDGGLRWLHARTFPVNDDMTGKVIRIVGLAEDISERKLAQLKAQQNLDRVRALHEIDVAIASTLDLRAVLNVLLEKIGAFFPLAAASTVRLVHPESGDLSSVACRNIDEAEWRKATEEVKGGLDRMLFKDNRPVSVLNAQTDPRSLSSELLKKYGLVSYLRVPLSAQGKVLGVLTVFTKAEHEFTPEEIEFLATLGGQAAIAIHNAQLYEQTKNQAETLARSTHIKDEFLSVMSHELRTPLSVIIGYTGLVRDGMLGEVNDKQADALKKVLGHASEQLGMINDIMQTTQLESRLLTVERQSVYLGELMESLKQDYSMQTDKSSATIVWDYPAGPVEIGADETKLKQILQNLINNALKFTRAGTVTVSARLEGAGPRAVVFKVADTGVGIPEERLANIFEKFYQVDSSETRLYGGVGLGLYIVKRFTDLLGGTVEVQSELGKGTTFTVKIPVEQ